MGIAEGQMGHTDSEGLITPADIGENEIKRRRIMERVN